MQALFWISAFLLFYTYIGYGLLLLLVNAFFKKKSGVDESLLPAVTFVVPAYNEEEIIRQKIENTLALDYPAEKVSFVFVTDGSTDKTPEIIRDYPQIFLLHQQNREGKSAAVNRAMRNVKSSVVVFSDANTMVQPQSVRKLVRHYADKNIGGVSGEKRVAANDSSAVGFGEKLYWQYESRLKKANSDFYTIVGAAGELFSLRTRLYRPLKSSIILDDFVLSATVCLQGFRFLYEPAAFGVETSSATIGEERKRKRRISAGCYQALFALPSLLNIFKNGRLAFQYVSHRVLRWVLCPLALPALLVSSAVLFARTSNSVYVVGFWLQVLFYFLTILGLLLAKQKKAIMRPLLLPAYFVFMVLSQYAGFCRFVTGRQTPVWEKARRLPVAGDKARP